MGFSRVFLKFFKIAERSSFAVKCDWKSKTSENIQNLFFLMKYMGLSKRICDFFENRQRWKFVLGCNWISKISQKVEKLAPSWKQRLVFRRKILSFLETAKGTKLAVHCDWMNRISWNLQNLGFWQKAAFFQKISRVFLKSLKVANFL